MVEHQYGVKQGSVLSPLLFLIVVDTLLKDLRHNEAGLSLLGLFVEDIEW